MDQAPEASSNTTDTGARPGSTEAVAKTLIVETNPPPEDTVEEPTLDEQVFDADEDEGTTAELDTEISIDDDEDSAESDDSLELADNLDTNETDDDDPTYEIKIDGEVVEVPLSELASNYSGEKAIAKRLQDATEARKQAENARDLAIEAERIAAKQEIDQERDELRRRTADLARVYSTYGEALTAPQVQPPDESLATSDPIKYMLEKERYRDDQERLRAQEAHMAETVQNAQKMEAAAAQERAQAESAKVFEEMPSMKDQDYRKKQIARVKRVGEALKFSDQELRALTTDRRLLYLAILAADGAEMIERAQKGNAAANAPQPKKASRAPAPAKTAVRRANGQFRKQREVEERARQTGDPMDVAATLIKTRAPSQKPRRRRTAGG